MRAIDVRNAEHIETLVRKPAAICVRDGALLLVGGVDGFRISTVSAGDAAS